MTQPLALLLALGAVDAPITQVTVFTDQARVVRTATVQVGGTQSFELPPLRDSVDVNSVRVEATGAEVRRVDLERVEPEHLRTEEARSLIAELEKADNDATRLSSEHAALAEHRAMLERLAPTVPAGDPLKPAPRLNASGWAAAAQFASEQLAKTQQRLREVELDQKKLSERREQLLDRARKLGSPQTTGGWRLTAVLSGNGPATLSVIYAVPSARWVPSWDLQLAPETNTVNLSLAGVVTQSTGEDWSNAALQLSTALPSRAVKVPKLLTWKIGTLDRFIPTATPVSEYVKPAPTPAAVARVRDEESLLREQLARAANLSRAESDKKKAEDFDERTVSRRSAGKLMASPPPPPPAPMPSSAPMRTRPAPVELAPAPAGPSVQGLSLESANEVEFTSDSIQGGLTQGFSLSPPPAWRPPTYDPDSPVTLAGGYDLTFTSLQRETVPSAGGARRVALWSQQWPVTVERKIYPALSQEAYLAAELKNPSQQVLPGGAAQLYVGADPAGQARLKLVAPGEAFTLPLGIDRAIKPIRNVKLVESTQGVVSKDDVSTYEVTTEFVNPYRSPISVRVYDQWPLSTQKDVEAKLLVSKPGAIQDAQRGSLEWRLTVAPQSKQVITFSYSIKRPKGWQLNQQEVTP